ncbi:MAG: hypothetical protein UT05_C0007G0041 [Parcubacteria group bacterium GW2011_GWF2_38_76]|nr:MAG: hypothetical protein UT05_C0007G0041 [Parcubacteria group bacterium GW2011_GWF2_38_76]HBM46083.1 hypothetical protein [Patescibacteria group bacterium]
MKSYIERGFILFFALVLLYFAIFDIDTTNSKVSFIHNQNNYCLYYSTIDCLTLNPNNKVTGFIYVYFNDSASTFSANCILIKYNCNSKKIKMVGPSLHLKNSKKPTGIFAKWCLEKNDDEIMDILTDALFAVIKKEYPNISVDPVNKELHVGELLFK